MPGPGHPRLPGRSVRVFRLLAALAVISALVAVVTIVKGDPAGRGQALVTAAIILGVTALVGLGLAAWPYM